MNTCKMWFKYLINNDLTRGYFLRDIQRLDTRFTRKFVDMERFAQYIIPGLATIGAMGLIGAVAILIMSIFMWQVCSDSQKRKASEPDSNIAATTEEHAKKSNRAESPRTSREAQTEATASCTRDGNEIRVVAQVDLVDAEVSAARRALMDMWSGETTSQKMRDVSKSTVLGPGEIRLESRNKVGPIHISSSLHLSTTVIDDDTSFGVRYQLIEPSFPIRNLDQTSWIEEPFPGIITIHSEQLYETETGWAGSIPGIQFIVGKVCGYKLRRAVEDMRDAVVDEMQSSDVEPQQKSSSHLDKTTSSSSKDNQQSTPAKNQSPIRKEEEVPENTGRRKMHTRQTEASQDHPVEADTSGESNSNFEPSGHRSGSSKRRRHRRCSLS